MPFEFRRAAGAADEIDALVGAHVGDVQQWRKNLVLQDADIQRGDRIRRRRPRARRQRFAAREIGISFRNK